MIELRAIRSGEIYNIIEYEDCYRTDDLYYPKSEADKVIADLEESHKKEVGQLLIEIAELKKEKEYVIEHTAEVINGQEQSLRHQKYKRCLAMAIACDKYAFALELQGQGRSTELLKRHNRAIDRKYKWLELAKEPTWAKFLQLIRKEAK